MQTGYRCVAADPSRMAILRLFDSTSRFPQTTCKCMHTIAQTHTTSRVRDINQPHACIQNPAATEKQTNTHILTLAHSCSRAHPSLAVSLNDRLSAHCIAEAFHRKWVSVVQIAVGLSSHPQAWDQEGSPRPPPAHCQSQRGGIWLRAGQRPVALLTC